MQGGGKSEEEELEELQGMIGGVPRGMFIKLKEAQKNRDLADRVRREKEEIAALRERRAQEQKERMYALRAKREQKHEAAKLAHRNKIVELGNAVRQEVKDLEDMKAHMASEHWKSPNRGSDGVIFASLSGRRGKAVLMALLKIERRRPCNEVKVP